MAEFLVRHLARLTANHRCIEFEIVVAHIPANLSRPEADLLIRDRVPDLASLVGRKPATFDYAVYPVPALARGCDGSPDALRALPRVGFSDSTPYITGHAGHASVLGHRSAPIIAHNAGLT